jgi:DNA-binding CsgD family transcriptional regulator
MPNDRALLTDRARALLLSFAISHNASDYCRFLTVVAFRDLGAISTIITRVEPDGKLHAAGQYGQPRPDFTGAYGSSQQFRLLKQAITLSNPQHGSLSAAPSPENGPQPTFEFMAIPFSSGSEVQGALGLTYRYKAKGLEVSATDVELLSLLSELIAINTLPRMRTSGALSKLYFDSSDLEEISAITHRQLRVLDEMAIGKTNGQIARSLNMSESTIKQESGRVFKILGVNSRQRAVSVAKEMGLI